MSLQPEVLTPDLLDEAWHVLEVAFGQSSEPADREMETALVDPARFLVVRDEGEVVATSGSFALRMTLPGGPRPVAGVTWVGVTATHRRRGLLDAMMRRLLTDRHEAGEAVAALWASEGAIYQRYGYGPATWRAAVEVPSRAAFTVPVARGGLRLVAPEAARLAPLYDAVVATRPGWWARDAAWWRQRLHDPAHGRGGASPLQCVVAHDGYALFSVVPGHAPTGSTGRLQAREVVAASPDTVARLWRFLLDLDLVRTVEARVAVDDPLLHLLAEPRAAGGRLGDGLWVRPVDVAGALTSRTYAAELDVVLDVTDPLLPWNTGRWRLSAGSSGAECAPTSDPADLAVGVADLGAALLGGTSLASRAAVGRVTELRPGALAAASTAFGTGGPAPSCPMTF